MSEPILLDSFKNSAIGQNIFDLKNRIMQDGLTMLSWERLDNVITCLCDVIANKISGDFIETGVWKGGTCILARGVFKPFNIKDRKVWVADSFEGLPENTWQQDKEIGIDFKVRWPELAVSLENVKYHFSQYGLLDDQVEFLKGWFKDTLPTAPIEKIAVLRLDGDMYESTMDALENLYDKVSPGGYIIEDDYHYWNNAKQAIDDFREKRNINAPLWDAGAPTVYWRKEA